MMITLYPEDRKPKQGDALPPFRSRIETPHGNGEVDNSSSEQTKIVYSRRRNTEEYFWQGEGALSIKCWFTGQGLYEADGGRFAVTPASYLMLNGGQRYSIYRQPEPEEESLLVFFAANFVEEIYHSQVTPSDHLLDDPWNRGGGSPRFYQKLYPHDSVLASRLASLRLLLAARKEEPDWVIEQLHNLLEALLRVHRQVVSEVEKVSALRQATRDELYRRLHYARDYAAASLDQPLTLQTWAAVACLSPNHFLRTFKQLFHVSPHQYLTRLRLERAQELLLKTNLSVTEICLDTGFESLGSFSTLFRRHLGLSPTGLPPSTRTDAPRFVDILPFVIRAQGNQLPIKFIL